MQLFGAQIDAGVSQFSWVDVEVTSDVCAVPTFGNIKSWSEGGADPWVLRDDVVSTNVPKAATGRHTQTVVPEYFRVAADDAALKRHIWALYNCCVQRPDNRRRLTSWLQIPYTNITVNIALDLNLKTISYSAGKMLSLRYCGHSRGEGWREQFS